MDKRIYILYQQRKQKNENDRKNKNGGWASHGHIIVSNFIGLLFHLYKGLIPHWFIIQWHPQKDALTIKKLYVKQTGMQQLTSAGSCIGKPP